MMTLASLVGLVSPVLSASERMLAARFGCVQTDDCIDWDDDVDSFSYADWDCEPDPILDRIRDRRLAQATSEMGFNDRAPFAKKAARRAERRTAREMIRESMCG